MSPKDARYAALRTFGLVDVTKEQSRDTRLHVPDQPWRDLAEAARCSASLASPANEGSTGSAANAELPSLTKKVEK